MTSARMVALLGREDHPTDALRDYSERLAEALSKQGYEMELIRFGWERHGWGPALRTISTDPGRWAGRWVLVQYTALSWSRRGFPLRVLLMLRLLNRAGAYTAVIMHDPLPAGGPRLIDKIRYAVQRVVMRACYRSADRTIVPVPLAVAKWLPPNATRAAFVPVGPNIPARPWNPGGTGSRETPLTVAVFGITGGSSAIGEIDELGGVLAAATRAGIRVRLVALGRGSEAARAELERKLSPLGVPVVTYGLVESEKAAEILAGADAFLFVRGHISTRRGSAMAAIACGVPVVGYSGAETAPPLTGAGVLLTPAGDRAGLARLLARVLADTELRARLSARNRAFYEEWLAWPAIARRILQTLSPDATA